MNRRLVLLSSVALVLGGVLMIDWKTRSSSGPEPTAVASQPPAVSPEAEATASEAMLNPLEDLGSDNFPSVLEKPLFNRSRAPRPPEPPPEPPPVVEEAPPEMPPEKPGPRAEDFTLVAVSSGSTGKVAAVRVAATNEVLYVREGQPVLEWSLLSVADKSVVIGTAESSVEIRLFEGDEAQPEAPMEEPPPIIDADHPPEVIPDQPPGSMN